jgi:hypothetical protein
MVNEKELKAYKDLDVLRNPTTPDSIYFVLSSLTQKVNQIWITSGQNIAKKVELDTLLAQDLISSQLGNILTIGTDSKLYVSQQDELIKISAESIPSHTPIAIYNNLAYKLDSSNPLHQFAFVGFSKNGTSLGQSCIIQQIGEITLNGWGLTQNRQYLAGTAGSIILDNTTLTNFTKVVGYSVTTDTLQIIKDYTTINK